MEQFEDRIQYDAEVTPMAGDRLELSGVPFVVKDVSGLSVALKRADMMRRMVVDARLLIGMRAVRIVERNPNA